MTVIIGVDPHKASHTAVAICGEEREVARVTVRATLQQTAKLLAWAEPFEERTWAIESAGGLGLLVGSAARRCGRARRRCPADAGLKGPGPRHWSFGQERSQRRIVGGARSCDCWPSATTIWAGCGPG
jgi:hypothetical protein